MSSNAFFASLFLVLLSVSQIRCANLDLVSLLREKYKDDLVRTPIIITMTNQDGEQVTYNLTRPLKIGMQPLIQDEYIELFQNFEENTRDVLYNSRIKRFIVDHAVETYEQNPISRQIINYCLQYGADSVYIHMLLASAVRKNVISLIYEILDSHEVSLIEDASDIIDYHEESFTKAVIDSGNYKIAKDLKLRNVTMDSPMNWIYNMALRPKWKHIVAAIDFIDFLIDTAGSLDLNNLNIGYPFLHIVLDGRCEHKSHFHFKQALAQHLVRRGANPNLEDYRGRTALQIAENLKIQLFPVEETI